MKRTLAKVAGLILACSSLFCTIGCGGLLTGGAKPSITDFSADKTDIRAGESVTFTVTGKNEKGFVNSSLTDYNLGIELLEGEDSLAKSEVKMAVAGAFEEKITVAFPKSGTKEVRVQVISGEKAVAFDKTITITVAPPILPASMDLNANNLTLNYKGTYTLKATLSPANASNKNVTYKSSNPKVATVSAFGIVTGVGPGSATITVTSSAVGSLTNEVSVTVKEPDGRTLETAKPITLNEAKSFYCGNGGEMYFEVNLNSSTPYLCFTATELSSDNTVSWNVYQDGKKLFDTDEQLYKAPGLCWITDAAADTSYVFELSCNWIDTNSGKIKFWTTSYDPR